MKRMIALIAALILAAAVSATAMADGEVFKMDKRNFVQSYQGGESMLRPCQRIYNLLDDLSKDDKTCLLVAHNGIARAVNSYFFDMTNEDYGNFGIKNCEILEYQF